jgi:hypothetical protein
MTQPKNISLTATLDIQAADAGDGKAPLPRFSMVAYTGGMMRIAGWRYPLVVDLAGLGIPSQSRPIRFGHDANSGVGHTDNIRVEGGQLLASGFVSRDTAAAREVVASARNGFPWQASIGAAVDQSEFVREDQTVLVNGREFKGPVNVVRRSALGEISFVDLGADGNTSATIAAGTRATTGADKEQSMEGKDTATDTQTTQDTAASAADGTTAAPASVQAAAVDQPDPVAEMRARAAAEQERIAAVQKVCGDGHADIAAKAIKDGWDVTRTELEVLRADRPKPISVHVPDNTITGNVLEAAAMLTANLQGIEKLHDEKTLDLAAKTFAGVQIEPQRGDRITDAGKTYEVLAPGKGHVFQVDAFSKTFRIHTKQVDQQ